MISRIDIEDMTDAQDEAPERIWADRISDEIKGFVDWSEGEWSSSPFEGTTEYVRHDLARPSQAGDERVAREARTAALREVDAIVEAFGPKRGNRWISRADLRAALAAAPQPEDDHPDIPDTPEERCLLYTSPSPRD